VAWCLPTQGCRAQRQQAPGLVPCCRDGLVDPSQEYLSRVIGRLSEVKLQAIPVLHITVPLVGGPKKMRAHDQTNYFSFLGQVKN
jgi:hypothetical protein